MKFSGQAPNGVSYLGDAGIGNPASTLANQYITQTAMNVAAMTVLVTAPGFTTGSVTVALLIDGAPVPDFTFNFTTPTQSTATSSPPIVIPAGGTFDVRVTSSANVPVGVSVTLQ